jgi:DnaJ-class molecular chaperone
MRTWEIARGSSMVADYYALLGVPHNASQADIKSAYRRKAKEYHPDVCSGDREPFLAIQEAYDVLSDPARRRTYDAQEARAREARARQPSAAPLWRQMIGERRAEPLRSSSRPVEPLIPDTATAERGWAFPWGEWDARGDEVDVEVALTPEQARYGGRVEAHIPVPVTCSACGGRGGRGFSMCSRCAGRGWIAERRTLRLSFPGGIAEGDEARVPLDRAGIPGVELIVRFVIEGW